VAKQTSGAGPANESSVARLSENRGCPGGLRDFRDGS
jgi:hypothetical protein